MKTINNRYATRRGEPMCSPRYPHTVAMEGRHIGLPLRWMNAVGRYIGLLGIHIGLPLLFLASCTQDDIAPAYNNSPLTITATIPGDVWAVATRVGIDGTYTDVPGITVTVISYSDWKLHYTDYNGNPASGTLTAAKQSDGSYSLTSGSDLVWAKVQDTQDADETFCLTCVGSDGATYYATTTAAHGAPTVAFTTAMTPTLAKITVNFTLSHNMATAPSADDFDVTIDAKMKADSYDPMTHGGTWPAAEGDAATTAFTLSQQSAATGTYTVTGSMLLPQQDLGNTMIVKYKETTWTLNLNAVAVTGGEEGKMANRLIAGQHLTLNLKAGLTAINTPSDIQIEAFTAADANSYNPDLGGVAKTYEYDDETNTYIVYDERCIEKVLANFKAKSLTTANMVLNGEAAAIVAGSITTISTVKSAIAGKTTIYVMGTTLAAYSDGTINNEAETVVGEAIRKLTEGTINLVMPDVTEIDENAFASCDALTSVSLPAATSIGTRAFASCDALASVSLPVATSIGNAAFILCTALTSVSLPEATTIGHGAFYSCTALTSVSLPEATTIGNSAFYLCKSLASVSLPAATSIGNAAFILCTALTSVSLPSATTIGQEAFINCYTLTSLTFGSVIESVGTNVFDGTLADGTTAWTTQCDLTLGTGSTGNPEAGENKTWAGYTWKSITLK